MELSIYMYAFRSDIELISGEMFYRIKSIWRRFICLPCDEGRLSAECIDILCHLTLKLEHEYHYILSHTFAYIVHVKGL